MKTLLHVGCGNTPKPDGYGGYTETRLDSDQTVGVDILASIVAMPMLKDEEFEAVYCSHTLEHVYHHEVTMALAEFFRVLKPGGMVEILVPDLQGIGSRLAAGELDTPIYLTTMGPIAPLDLLYGHRASVAQGRLGMAHKTGFTQQTLRTALHRAGFEKVLVDRVMNQASPELKAVAIKGDADASQESSTEGLPLRE
jgi:ubiquinone/menaquinone biosynthesis C-methylase UbiE